MLLRINICGIFVYGLNGVVMNLKGGFEDYKISTKNMPLKLAGFILSFAIALTAIGFGVSKLIEKGMNNNDISLATGIHAYRVGLLRTSPFVKNPQRLENAIHECAKADRSTKLNYGQNTYSEIKKLLCSI